MYRDSGVTAKGYEDAIPIKRSKRSERARNEQRQNAAKNRGTVEFYVRRTDIAERSSPAREAEPAPATTRQIPKAAPAETPAETKAPAKRIVPPAKVVRPPVKAEVSEMIPEALSVPVSRPVTVVAAEKIESETTAEPEIKEELTSAVGEIAEQTPTETEPAPEVGSTRIEGFSTISRVSSVPKENADAVKPRLTAGKIVRRSLLSVFTALLLAVAAVFGACYTVAVGPSESVRNVLVLSALQASATKWVPGLFLDDAVVEQILEDSKKVNKDVISVEDYQNSQSGDTAEDKWANAIDGMIYEPVSGPTFKGYVLLVKDPSRVSVGVATTEYTADTQGLRIFEMAEKYGAVAAINGGEYPDAGGMGTGGRPIGLTYSDGECVWNDGLRRSFMGFDENDRLVVREGLTYAQAEELGIRDGVCFQTGKTLITNEDGNVTLYYADNDTGTAQRTAIGQAADGTVILLVTDGRTASSLGATHNDVIDVMVSYGAISAGMLDGGSSSLMYYKDFYDKYGIDKSDLDEYQRMGLINKYKAFTTPRRLPTCFIVAPE